LPCNAVNDLSTTLRLSFAHASVDKENNHTNGLTPVCIALTHKITV
jgi:hypothetical protein